MAASEAGLLRTTRRGLGRALPAVPAAALALIAGLTLAKLLLYVAAAQPFGGAEQALCQWDCEWYVHTIQHGYDQEPPLRAVDLGRADQANWAFFPLFPVLARGLGAVSGLGAFWAGMLASALCFAAFAALSLRYRALTRGPRARDGGRGWIALLLAYPFSLYFLVPYSESLYLLLTLLVLLAVRARRPAGAGLATALLTATRPTGVVAIPYLAAERLWHARLAFRPGLDLGARLRVLADCALPLALAPLGLALYMAYLYWLTGDALAFSHVQFAWGKSVSAANPVKSLYWALATNDWAAVLEPHARQSHSLDALFVIPAGLACVWLLWRRLWLETWLLGATVLLALMTGVESMPRFVTTNAAFVLAVGDAVDRIGSRALRFGLLAACALLQAFLLSQWFIRSSLLM